MRIRPTAPPRGVAARTFWALHCCQKQVDWKTATRIAQSIVSNEERNEATASQWLVYVTGLPTDDPAARMRVLRTLESLGCAVLREGVYLLPESEANRQGLARLTEYIFRLHGSAYILSVTATDVGQERAFRGLFSRSDKYGELIKTVEALKSGFGISEPASIARVLAKQRREFEAISALDFFSSPGRELAARVLKDAEDRVRSMVFPDAPKPSPTARPARNYFKRIWATRKPLWADRLASAWLVRRFIDPEGTLIWLEKSQDCPAAAVGFGFEGAEFANSKSGITFEQLLANFGLQTNAALTRIGALVHYLDTGGTPVAEAAGVETLLLGAQRRSSSTDELYAECEKTFDLLYDAYIEAPARS
jgi:hypothetical protein